jgi:hypothetical protein
MYYWQEKNLKIDKNSKILIGLGDSFTQGQGACSIDLWEKYDWDINKMNLDAEVKALEMRAEMLKSKDDFLHKEIEWLVLDKQRAEMTRLTQENN